MRFSLFFCALILLALPAMHVSAKADLPLPRFVSLKSSEANVRTGPGLRYQIKWVVVRKDLPVEVIAESENWRKIKDIDGDEGWVHRSMLSNQRKVTVLHTTQTLYEEENRSSRPVAFLEAGVHADLLECDDSWCELRAKGMRGYMPRQNLWGLYADELEIKESASFF